MFFLVFLLSNYEKNKRYPEVKFVHISAFDHAPWKISLFKFQFILIIVCVVVVYVVVQFYPWFTFYFLSFLGMVIYDYEFKTKENKI